MSENLIITPVVLLMKLRPWKIVGHLMRPEKITKRPERIEDTLLKNIAEAQDMMVGSESLGIRWGSVPEPKKKGHLRLVAVDGKIVDPNFQ